MMEDMVASGAQGHRQRQGLLSVYQGRRTDGKRRGSISPTTNPQTGQDKYDSRKDLKCASWIFLFCCNLMWALQFTCIKLVQDQVGPMFTVWGPMTLAMFMLIPFVLRDSVNEAKGRAREKLSVSISCWRPGRFSGAGDDDLGDAAIAGQQRGRNQPDSARGHRIIRGALPARADDPDSLGQLCRGHLGVLFCSGIDFRSLSFGSSYLLGNALIFAATLGSAFYNRTAKRRWSSTRRCRCCSGPTWRSAR